jgi:hypothetical protein
LNNWIVKRVFPDLENYQKKEEEHQKQYYRSKTKEIKDSSNPLKRRRKELEPLRRTTSTRNLVNSIKINLIAAPRLDEEIEKKPEPEPKRIIQEKERKPKKVMARQNKKKTFKKSDGDITILDIDPDKVIEIIEDNDDESNGIIILDDEPEDFIQKKKKTSVEQEVILIDESTDCEEIKEDKRPHKPQQKLKSLPVTKKPEHMANPIFESKDLQQLHNLAAASLQLELVILLLNSVIVLSYPPYYYQVFSKKLPCVL